MILIHGILVPRYNQVLCYPGSLFCIEIEQGAESFLIQYATRYHFHFISGFRVTRTLT